MTTHLFAVGKVDDNRDILIRPAYAPASEDAYTIGEMQGDDGFPCEPLNFYSDLACIEAFICGWQDAQAPATKLRPLQEFIDAGAALDAAARKHFGEFARCNFPQEDKQP